VRIDSLNKEILTLMKRTGFYSLTFAIESGSQTILDNVDKKTKLKVIPEKLKIAKKLGYIIPSFFIFGLPGETYETARRTIQFAKNLPLDFPAFFIAKPLPGSRLFEDWKEKNELPETDFDWFHFHEPGNTLRLSDGKNKLDLPRDAYREFLFRPRQLLRMIKLIKYYPKRYLIRTFRRVLRYI